MKNPFYCERIAIALTSVIFLYDNSSHSRNKWCFLMYVCNCNGLTERQVDAALRKGAKTWPDVYAFYNCEPKCGKCVPDVAARLNKSSPTAEPSFFPQSALGKA